jgi:hypothetical protein
MAGNMSGVRTRQQKLHFVAYRADGPSLSIHYIHTFLRCRLHQIVSVPFFIFIHYEKNIFHVNIVSNCQTILNLKMMI